MFACPHFTSQNYRQAFVLSFIDIYENPIGQFIVHLYPDWDWYQSCQLMSSFTLGNFGQAFVLSFIYVYENPIGQFIAHLYTDRDWFQSSLV